MDKKERAGIVMWLFIALLLFLVPVGCNRSGESKGQGERRTPTVKVEVVEVQKERIPHVVTFVGELEPRKRATITAKVSGVIEHLYVQEGDHVNKGQILAAIEQDDYIIALKAAEAALAEAAARLEQAERDHRRFAELIEKKVIAQQRYEEAKTAYKLAQAGYQSAQAILESARTQVDNTTLKAPFSGFVTARLKEEGERVRAGMPGQEASLLEMENISFVRATGYLPEVEIGVMRRGLNAQVKVDALPDRAFTGKVTVVNPRIDPATRTFMVKVEIPNRKFVLKGNMFARVTIVKGYHEALTIPREAVLREEGVWVYHCFVAHAGKAQRRVIKPKFTSFPYVEVEDGLKEGERVIVKGQHLLRGGEALAIIGG